MSRSNGRARTSRRCSSISRRRAPARDVGSARDDDAAQRATRVGGDGGDARATREGADEDDDVVLVEASKTKRRRASLDVVVTGEATRDASDGRVARDGGGARARARAAARAAAVRGATTTTTAATTAKTTDGNANAETRGRCAVCLDDYVNATTTRCGHVFCARCVRAAIEHSGTCPTCRKKVTRAQCHRVFL